ncbi:MAG: hypothetical protein JXR73_05925 [Candidatus Omnitrophica bacterium]|nr:hypothetical protein [Candidatus Omnitrophota bacterium]
MKKQTLRESILNEIYSGFGKTDCVKPDSVVIHSQTFSHMGDLNGNHQLLVDYLFDLVEDLQQGASKEQMLKKVLQLAAHFEKTSVSLNDRLRNLFEENNVILSE